GAGTPGAAPTGAPSNPANPDGGLVNGLTNGTESSRTSGPAPTAEPAAPARTAAFPTSSNATTMPVPQITEPAQPPTTPAPATSAHAAADLDRPGHDRPAPEKPGLDKPVHDRPAEANVRPLATTPPSAQAAPATTVEPGPADSAPSGPVEITCREERLDITTDWHVVGTAKLRKYVTSEPVERRIRVVRERVRVERMPVSESERAALTEKEIEEAVEEVTLREERPVVRKYLAPIERVRLVVERYTAEEVVRDELRREHVEVHDSTAGAAQHGSPAAAGMPGPQHPAPPSPASSSTSPSSAPPSAPSSTPGGEGRPAPLRPLV
ncbi:YsnF/AvaK domain-containing protein, partial [Kitasatospora sp. NPDC004240]